jgi:hypothetical protein
MYHDVTNLKFKQRRNEGQPEKKRDKPVILELLDLNVL